MLVHCQDLGDYKCIRLNTPAIWVIAGIADPFFVGLGGGYLDYVRLIQSCSVHIQHGLWDSVSKWAWEVEGNRWIQTKVNPNWAVSIPDLLSTWKKDEKNVPCKSSWVDLGGLVLKSLQDVDRCIGSSWCIKTYLSLTQYIQYILHVNKSKQHTLSWEDHHIESNLRKIVFRLTGTHLQVRFASVRHISLNIWSNLDSRLAKLYWSWFFEFNTL